MMLENKSSAFPFQPFSVTAEDNRRRSKFLFKDYNGADVDNKKCWVINLRPFLWWRYDFGRSLIDHFNSEINLTLGTRINWTGILNKA